MSAFTSSLAGRVEKRKDRNNIIIRKVMIDMAARLIERSPVGNPDLWKSNQGQAYKRETYNLFAGALGVRPVSSKSLRKKFPNATGKGYVGGRFRANWSFSVNVPAQGTTQDVDPGGGKFLAEVAAGMSSYEAGPMIWISNNLPYGQRLEHGYSKQAPQGMVRITKLEFADILREAAR